MGKPRGSAKTTYRLQILVEVDEDGVYVASCPALQGCYTQGGTFEEALANIGDVIKMCAEELRESHADVDSLPSWEELIRRDYLGRYAERGKAGRLTAES